MKISLKLFLCLPLLLCFTITASSAEWPKLVLQTGHVGAADIVAFRPDGKILNSAGGNAVMKLWD